MSSRHYVREDTSCANKAERLISLQPALSVKKSHAYSGRSGWVCVCVWGGLSPMQRSQHVGILKKGQGNPNVEEAACRRTRERPGHLGYNLQSKLDFSAWPVVHQKSQDHTMRIHNPLHNPLDIHNPLRSRKNEKKIFLILLGSLRAM